MIKASLGRWALMLIVLGGFVFSVVSLFVLARGGAIHPDAVVDTLKSLLTLYLPLLTIMVGFYFSDGGETAHNRISKEALFFSVAIAALWCVCPPLILIFGGPIESALAEIGAVATFGQTAATGAVTFYFAKASRS